ncbi:hypothetical protein AB0G85_37470 [Streptomyces sioyaensis]|uniref:hypothetical protein n=1 Tax=Streptomyces sioyaensis TaxID=67364 RepID=UPI0033E3EE76
MAQQPPADGRRDDEQARDSRHRQAYGAWHHHATAALSPAVPPHYHQQLTAFAATLGELADERPRAALTVARQLREIAAHLEPLAVAESLAHGVPWETLAADLGHTRQNIHSCYNRPSRNLTDRIQAITGTTLETLLTKALPAAPEPTHPAGTGPPSYGASPHRTPTPDPRTTRPVAPTGIRNPTPTTEVPPP